MENESKCSLLVRKEKEKGHKNKINEKMDDEKPKNDELQWLLWQQPCRCYGSEILP